MSVRDDPVLFLRGGKGGNAFGTVAGGNATTTAVTHRLDGPEHAAADDTTRLDATVDEHGLLPKLSGDPDDVLGGDGAWANRLARLRAISPTTLAANTDNWNPTGLSTADVIRVATDASRNLTGITAPAVARALLLLNVGSFDLVLKDDVTSTAANRFFLPYGDVTLVPDAGAELWYDVTTGRWRIVAVVTSAGASFGTPANTYGTPAAGAASTAIRTDAVLPAPNKVVLTLTNKVGSAVAAGDVVKVNTGTDESFNSTTTGQAEVSIGIVQETIADNASGRVLVSGYAALVNVPSSVTRGHYVETHTVAKQAVGNSSRRAGSFGQFLTGGTTPSAILWGQTDQTASAGVSFATPAIVLGTAAAAGAASTVIRSDSTIVAFDATVPVTQAFSDSAAAGSAAFAARRDHKHGMPASPGGGGSDLVQTYSGAGSVYVPGLRGSPDRLPASPNAKDDEFEALSGWTTLGTLDTSNVSDIPSHLHLIRACSSEIDGLYKAIPSMPFTITIKLSAFRADGSAHQSAGILLTESAPGKVDEISINWASNTTLSVSLRRYTNRTTFATSVDDTILGPLTGGQRVFPPQYLRCLVTSSSSITVSFSWDGLVWRTPSALTGVTPSLTPANFGVCVSDPVSASTVEAAFDYIRVT